MLFIEIPQPTQSLLSRPSSPLASEPFVAVGSVVRVGDELRFANAASETLVLTSLAYQRNGSERHLMLIFRLCCQPLVTTESTATWNGQTIERFVRAINFDASVAIESDSSNQNRRANDSVFGGVGQSLFGFD